MATACLLALGACTVDGADGPAAGALEGRLAAGAALPILRGGAVALTADQAGVARPVTPGVRGGQVVVRAVGDDRLAVQALTIDLDDVDLEHALGDTTRVLHLTDLHLRLGTQRDGVAAWRADGAGVDTSTTVELVLDWALRADDGDVLPFASQRIGDVGLELQVTADGPAVVATVDARVAGPIWNFGDVIVRDLDLTLALADAP
ncbi:MAG: hypothetical protein IPL61_26950 [Myxococcales bacterium]|nr:hypothetical protein [Myxococcales bacterium]